MQFTNAEIALAVTASTISIGSLAIFLILIILRQYRLNVKRQFQLLNAVIEAQDSERQRIAEDMHDGLGQLLAATKLQTDALRHSEASQLPDKIKTIKETLDQASTEVRTIINDLIPRRLERVGLWKAIEELTNAINASQQLHSRLETIGIPMQYNERVQLNLYRILQELITNAVKHANASEVVVYISNSTHRLEIAVSDDGVGFNEQKEVNGNGLRNVRSRTAWLNGTITHNHNQPHGTCIRLIFQNKYLQRKE